ncbi:MAG: hypothetical protein V3T83_04320, partial [Acidobacteriota bacterium]
EGYASFNDTGNFFPPVLGRPWAGGHDTLHTMIYYDTYEKDFFKNNPMHESDQAASDGAEQREKEKPPLIDCTVQLSGKLGTSGFDIGRIIGSRKAFADHLRDMHAKAFEPTYSSFQRWQGGFEPLRQNGQSHHWLVFGDKCIQLDKLVYRILKLASENKLPLGDLLDGFKPDLKVRLLDYFAKLESVGAVIFHDPAKPPPLTPKVARSHSEALRREVTSVPAGNAGAELPVLPPG